MSYIYLFHVLLYFHIIFLFIYILNIPHLLFYNHITYYFNLKMLRKKLNKNKNQFKILDKL
jgi:hypothetical protein